MDQKLKRVKRVEHLYERAYRTASGEKRVKFYAIFTCKLKHKRRVIALGGDFDAAKEELAQLLADNLRGDGKDFDAVGEPQQQGLTFREWAQDYFKNKIDPTRKAGGLERERRSYKPLLAFFGDMLLTDIKRKRNNAVPQQTAAGPGDKERQGQGCDGGRQTRRARRKAAHAYVCDN
jgi:hypothetical protein